MAKLGRLLTAMVTPMDEAGKVDWDQTKRLANALLDSGSDGMVVGATTGEGPTLRHEEKLRLWGEVKAAVGERGAVVANTGNYSTWESIQMSREFPTTTSRPRRASTSTSKPSPDQPTCRAFFTTFPAAPA